MPTTSYAVLTKSRAKFGKRLTEKDYTSLLACQSVAEVMSYLKSYTRYSAALRDINERDVHRGRLEAMLKQELFYEFDSLCRYDSSISSGFTRYAVENIEVEQIIRFLILLNSSSTDKFIYQFPAYFSKHTEIDIDRLANAKSYDEFLSVLSSSSYYDILKSYAPDEKGRLHISEIENKLYELVFTNLMNTINIRTKGQEKRELKSLLMTINDYNIFSMILRLKKYYNLPADAIKENLLTEFCDIDSKTIDMMCNAESSAEVFSVMQSTHNGKLIDKIGYVYASDISPRVKFRLARKNMHFSNNPSVVLISYMFVSEIELMNIISLIEGIRYKLDSKKIQSMLIY
ncbi:MAG: V-type ATPase subunit [Clostridiales bacterium]|nr:V-type ATPase subunit [Clostridiales bacterium]